jgi:hypothetical protein
VMLADFVATSRVWHASQVAPVVAYGLANMAFMAAYFFVAGCADAPLECDLDAEGNPWVYEVVDWRQPPSAALVCVAAIAVPVPLISLLLSAISRARGARGPRPSYPYGENHNGTVSLPDAPESCASAAEVARLLRGDAAYPIAPRGRVRAVGSAKSNTRCLEAPGAMVRLAAHDSVRIAPDRKSALVGAGATERSIAAALSAAGLQLCSSIELGNITAGAMAVSHTKNRHLPGEKAILSSFVTGDCRGIRTRSPASPACMPMRDI